MIPQKFASLLRQSALRLADFFSPPRCRACREGLFDHSPAILCRDCLAALVWLGDGCCPACGYPAGEYAHHSRPCRRCEGKLHLDGAAAVARYRGGARELVKSLKFRGETELAAPLAGLMAARLAAVDWKKKDWRAADAVVPVPLHEERRRERGFNQAELLARALGAALNKPVETKILARSRPTTPQARLGRERRRMNVDGAFLARPAAAGRRILLVDDVMTTGATMSDCARACREAGAAGVWGVVFAR